MSAPLKAIKQASGTKSVEIRNAGSKMGGAPQIKNACGMCPRKEVGYSRIKGTSH